MVAIRFIFCDAGSGIGILRSELPEIACRKKTSLLFPQQTLEIPPQRARRGTQFTRDKCWYSFPEVHLPEKDKFGLVNE
jgi:hypothetical protein